MEDDYLKRRSNRSRYPPVHIRSANLPPRSLTASGQNTSKRRVLKDGSNTIHVSTSLSDGSKKKRKQIIEEAKAERKRHKLEQKAQKMANKESKKKQREEMRDKEKLARQQKEKTQAVS